MRYFILSISGSEHNSPQCTIPPIMMRHPRGGMWWTDLLCTRVRTLKRAITWVTALNRSKTRPQTLTKANSTRIRNYTKILIWLDSHFNSRSIRHNIRTIGKRSVRISKTTSRRNLKFTERLNFPFSSQLFQPAEVYCTSSNSQTQFVLLIRNILHGRRVYFWTH